VRGNVLYLRSRRVPAALAVATGATLAVWAAWSVFSTRREVAVELVVLVVLLPVTAAAGTLAGPDDAFERTAARPWPVRRALHLLAVAATVVLLLAATSATGARFGPFWLVARDAAGLAGLTALCAVVAGAPRAWLVPLGWTMIVLVTSDSSTGAGRVLRWMLQYPDDRAAGATAVALACTGAIAYALRGSRTATASGVPGTE